MLNPTGRVLALLMALLVSAGNLAICAGWAPTPEARMQCCSADGSCPMHEATSAESGGALSQHVSQADADRCCASSERDSTNQSNPTFGALLSSAVPGTVTILAAPVPALVSSDRWRTVAPIPSPPVARHVLLSVFLV